MSEKKEIVICLGSSCFSRGNKELLPIIQKYIRKNNLQDKVVFRGEHCFEQCLEGPNIKIGQKIYNHVNVDTISGILEEGLK